MTPAAYRLEWDAYLTECLGIMCGTRQPTEAQAAEAKRLTIEHMDALEAQEKANQ